MSDLERRLRRIVWLVGVFGIAGGIVGMFPVRDPVRLGEIHTAYGLPLWMLVCATLLYGSVLLHNPRRLVAIGWMVWTAMSLLTFFGITWDDHLMSAHDVWPLTIVHALIGAMVVLVFPVTTFVLIASTQRPPSDAPSARLVTR